jgi:hypothetical protein
MCINAHVDASRKLIERGQHNSIAPLELSQHIQLREAQCDEFASDSPLEEAVCCELVSPAEFPDKWPITGNFTDLIPDR